MARRWKRMRFGSLLKAQGALLLVIAAMFLTFLLQNVLGESIYETYMLFPADVVNAWNTLRAGDYQHVEWSQFLTLFTPAMLHADAGHIIGNMTFLWIFGALASELLGYRCMLFVFVFTAITGSLCHIALNPDDIIPCLGASGTVMGFEGLYLAMAVRWHLPDPHVWPMARPIAPSQLAMVAIIGLFFDFMGLTGGDSNVAHGAHLGGFIGGILLGSFFVNMPRVALPR
jgi:membrane associated rhomboid family serine protease